MGNALKTTLLLGLLTGFLLFVGQYFGGQNGMILALVFAGVMNFVSYFFSDKIALLSLGAAFPIAPNHRPGRGPCGGRIRLKNAAARFRFRHA